ncbi:MAG: ABC transporter ATP-binding protein [Phycisphaera sp. TMED24]|jgi:ABC-2 type transport system ATP-binding protein|nr:MAG: ABC transporter ATP-binding protein [Phycisphaera sp. TMED24]
MTATAPIVEASGLTKVFRDFWRRPRVRAVDSIAFEIRRGEIFGLLGPNGSGKSTTIKMILGLLHKTSGRLSVFGRAPDDVAVKKHIGFLPEESYLYRFLDARETLDYYGKLFGLEASVRKRRTDELLQMVGLERVAHRPIGEYSKGMMRRIGIAQALVNDPEFLILDEPTSGLDPLGTRQVKDLLLDLKSRGKTILLSSHLLADVEDVCDRMVILYGGKVRAEGTSEELLRDSGRSVIETDRLDPEATAAVQSVLAERGLADATVAAPRQSLEHFFLDIVARAQSEAAATDGARTGSGTAAFLREESTGDDVVQSLLETTAAPEAAEVVVDKSTSEAETAAATDSVIGDLVDQEAAPDRADRGATPSDSESGPDRGVIDDLLGGGER